MNKTFLTSVALCALSSHAFAGADYATNGYYQPAPVRGQNAYGNGYNYPANNNQPQQTQRAYQPTQQPRYAAPQQPIQQQSYTRTIETQSTQNTYQPTQQPRYAAPAPVQQPQYTAPATQYSAPAAVQQQSRYIAPAQTQQYDYNKPYQGAIAANPIEYDNEVFSPTREMQRTRRAPTRTTSATRKAAPRRATNTQGPISLGAQIGTLGIGGEISYEVNDAFTLRGNPSFGAFSYDGDESGIEYDSDLTLANFGVLADWQPLKNGFRVTGGLFFSGDDIEMVGENTNQIIINNVNYNTTQVQSVTADVERDIVQPYLGIGYSGGLSPKSKWQFSADLGAKYIGDADVSMSARTGVLGGVQAAFDNDLEQERRQLENSLSDWSLYPVVMVGAKYQF